MRDAQKLPRYADVPTFLRTEYQRDLDDSVDVPFLGIPWGGDSVWNSGARWGPRAVRNASTYLKPYEPTSDTDLRDYNIVDAGDLSVVPGYIERTLDLVEEEMREILEYDVKPAYISNDAMPLAVLRAVADKHGPLSLVHFDAHADLWPGYFGAEYNHGTWVHHAIEENLIDPETSIRVGDRGALYNPEDLEMFEEAGIEYYTTDEAIDMGPETIGERIQEVATGPAYTHIDLDVLDSSAAVGVSGPEPFGLYPRELKRIVQYLDELETVTTAVVEVCAPNDPTGNTSMLGAHLLYHMICAMLSDPDN